MAINVFMIEDHYPIIEAQTLAFEDEQTVSIIGHASNSQEATDKIHELKPDIILMDLYLDDQDPLDHIHLIRDIFPEIPVVMYSAECSVYWKIKILELGISAYLCKGYDEERIVGTLHSVFDRYTLFPAEVISFFLKKQITVSKGVTITKRQLEICYELAYGSSLKIIADKLKKSAPLIEQECRTIREKLNAATNAEVVRIMTQNQILPVGPA